MEYFTNYFTEFVTAKAKEYGEECHHHWGGHLATGELRIIPPACVVRFIDGKPVPEVYCPVCRKVPKRTEAAFVKKMEGLRFVDHSAPKEENTK